MIFLHLYDIYIYIIYDIQHFEQGAQEEDDALGDTCVRLAARCSSAAAKEDSVLLPALLS